MLTQDAAVVRRAFNGLLCIYKPSGMTWGQLWYGLVKRVADELNTMKVREPKKFFHIDGDTTKPLKLTMTPNYADHPLMTGPRYTCKDFKVNSVKKVGDKISGVFVIGVNNCLYQLYNLHGCNPLSTYHITGQFGLHTNNLFKDGKISYTCNYNKLERGRIDKSIAVIQALHRRYLAECTGFHLTSQESYELLASGKIRPAISNIPVIYSLKCIDWNLPYFTIEIVCANENEQFLLNIVEEIGARNKNLAIANKIRCIRYAFFSVEDALLTKHWTLQYCLDNMELCKKRLELNDDYLAFLKKVEEQKEEIPKEEEEEEEPVVDEYLYEESKELYQ